MVLAEFCLSQGPGLLASFVLFLAERVKDRRDWQREMEADKREETIRDYLEWLRRQNHAELLAALKRRDRELAEFRREFADYVESLEEVLNTIYHDHQAALSEVEKEIRGLRGWVVKTTSDLLRIPQLPPALAKRTRRDHAPALLKADAAVVPFFGREAECADIREWCESDADDPLGVRVYLGPGGQGKTRLFIELCREFHTKGWAAGFLRSDIEDFSAGEIRWVLGCGLPVLVVVDYAASRLDHIRKLLAQLLDPARSENHRVRVVLLERSEGEWWEELKRSGEYVGDYLAQVPNPKPLGSLASGLADRESLFASACRVYGDILGKPVPRESVPDLSDDTVFGLALMIQVAALAFLDGVVSTEQTELLDHVVRRETHIVEELFLAQGLPKTSVHTDSLRELLALTTLVGPLPDKEYAASLLGSLPDWQDCSPAVVRALHALYPEGRAGIRGVEPDLVGEHLVCSLGAQEPHAITRLLQRVWADLRTSERHWAFVVLSRIAQRLPDLSRLADEALHLDLAGNLLPALLVARSMGTPLLDSLSKLAVTGIPPSLLASLTPHLPEQTVALRRFACAVQQSVVESLKALPSTELSQCARYAGALNDLANRLSECGQRREALAKAQEAVSIWRDLAAANPDAFRPNLSISLSNLAAMLSGCGQWQEAMAKAQEAVSIWRELAAADPDAFRPYLAGSLNTLANRLNDCGQWQEAVGSAQEAVDIYRNLAEANSDAFRPNLAASSNNLAAILSRCGQQNEALASARETASIYRELVAANSDAFRPDLAMALNNLAAMLSDCGQRSEALGPALEAVDIYRELAAASPDAFRPYLATSLGMHGAVLRANERYAAAVKSLAEGLAVILPMAETFPGAFLSLGADLAQGMTTAATNAQYEFNEGEAQLLVQLAALMKQAKGGDSEDGKEAGT